MRYVVAFVGVVASLVMLVVSGFVNFRFGMSLGRTEFDGLLFGGASAAADGLKAISPLVAGWFFVNRQRLYGFFAVVVFVVCTGYSLTSAVGFAALNRSDVQGGRAAVSEAYKAAQETQKRLEGELDALGPQRPSEAVRSALSGAEQNRRWSSTSGCTDATVAASREFCQGYAALQAELAIAERTEALKTDLKEAKATVARLRGAGGELEADPQASALSKISGIEMGQVSTGLVLIVALLMEIGSGLGLAISLYPFMHAVKLRPGVPAQAAVIVDGDEVGAFCVEMLVPSEGSAVTLGALFSAYRTWCRDNGLKPVPRGAFGVEVHDLMSQAGIAGNGRGRFYGIALSKPDYVDVTPEALPAT